MKHLRLNQRIDPPVAVQSKQAGAWLARRSAAGVVCTLTWVLVCAAGMGLGFPRMSAAEGGGDGAEVPATAEEAIDPAMPGLMEAIYDDDVAQLKAILDAHPGLLEKPVRAGNTTKPAWYAAAADRMNVLKYLLVHGTLTKDVDPEGQLLRHCALGGKTDLLELLIARGGDINQIYSNTSVLMVALAEGSPENVRTLQKMGADIRLRANDGQTAWHFAAQSSTPAEMFTIVQESGLDVNACESSGITPLMVYVSRRIARNRDLDDEPQIASYEQGWRFLADHGVDYKSVSNLGETVLHFAACSGEGRTIQLCLEAGLDVNARTPEDQTPLDIAIENGNMDTAAELIQHGGQLHLVCSDGASPLQHVFGLPGPKPRARGFYPWMSSPITRILPDSQKQIIAGLIRLGCDPNIESSPLGTPLALASVGENQSLAAALLDSGADPNFLFAGGTPLAIAVQYRNLKTVELLLAHGANPRIPDSKTGETPLETLLSRSRGDPLFNILWRLDLSNKRASTSISILVCLYNAQQTPVNIGLLAVFSLVVLSAGLWIRRWIAVHGAGLTGAGAEATLDEISARADWKELLAKFEEAQAFQRRVFLHRPWILIGAFGWVFGVGLLWYDPILNLLVQPQAWWYVALFSLAFLVSCGLQFARASGWRIFGASLGIVALVVGGFFASAAVYVLFAYPRLYLPGGVLALAILATLTAAWRFHRTLKAEMALRRIQLPPGFEFHRKAAAENAEIEPSAGWDEGR